MNVRTPLASRSLPSLLLAHTIGRFVYLVLWVENESKQIYRPSLSYYDSQSHKVYDVFSVAEGFVLFIVGRMFENVYWIRIKSGDGTRLGEQKGSVVEPMLVPLCPKQQVEFEQMHIFHKLNTNQHSASIGATDTLTRYLFFFQREHFLGNCHQGKPKHVNDIHLWYSRYHWNAFFWDNKIEPIWLGFCCFIPSIVFTALPN